MFTWKCIRVGFLFNGSCNHLNLPSDPNHPSRLDPASWIILRIIILIMIIIIIVVIIIIIIIIINFYILTKQIVKLVFYTNTRFCLYWYLPVLYFIECSHGKGRRFPDKDPLLLLQPWSLVSNPLLQGRREGGRSEVNLTLLLHPQIVCNYFSSAPLRDIPTVFLAYSILKGLFEKTETGNDH